MFILRNFFLCRHREIPILTCTQTAQQWGKISKAVATDLYQMDKLSNMPEYKRPTTKFPQATPDENRENLNILLSGTYNNIKNINFVISLSLKF